MAPGQFLHSNKRRKLDPRKHGVEELAFDPEARADYLTGFHRRKQQRLKQAAETAARRAREQQVADRKALREQRKADLEAHVQTVKAMMAQAERGAAVDSSDNDEDAEDANLAEEGEDDEEEENAKQDYTEADEVEYVDEDRYTAVTIGPLDESSSSEHGDGEDDRKDSTQPRKPPNKAQQLKKVRKTNTKPSKKAFRYESPAERKAARSKQARKNSQAARVRKGGTR